MADDQTLRVEALRLYNKLSRTARFIKHQTSMCSGSPPNPINVVAALNTDLVHDVEERVRRAGGVAAVVVYWPESGRMRVVRVGDPRDDYLLGVNPVDVHSNSSIEMLLSLMDETGPVYTTPRAEVLE